MLGGGECTGNEHGLSNLSSAALITAFFNVSRWVNLSQHCNFWAFWRCQMLWQLRKGVSNRIEGLTVQGIVGVLKARDVIEACQQRPLQVQGKAIVQQCVIAPQRCCRIGLGDLHLPHRGKLPSLEGCDPPIIAHEVVCRGPILGKAVKHTFIDGVHVQCGRPVPILSHQGVSGSGFSQYDKAPRVLMQTVCY